MATLSWIDRKGAGCSRRGSAVILAKKLETLRCHATLRSDDGEIIGGCEATDNADDKRIKWLWWYDKSAL